MLELDVVLDCTATALQRAVASTLTRVLILVGSDSGDGKLSVKKPFSIISAARSDLSSDANSRRTQQMDATLQRSGIKSYRLKGNWLEAPEDSTFEDAIQNGTLVQIAEEALFCVPENGVAFSTFEKICVRQADRFNQDALILGSGELETEDEAAVWLRFRDGHMKGLPGTMQVAELEAAYRDMRGQRGHPWVFA